jgi:hypothetical protein
MVAVGILASALLVVGLVVGYLGPTPSAAGIEARGGPRADEGGAEEAEEQQEKTEQRNEAFEKAKREGKTGQQRLAAAAPGAGDRDGPERSGRLRTRDSLWRSEALLR